MLLKQFFRFFLQLSPWQSILLIGIAAFLIFSLNDHQLSIYALDEAKNAECAREMLEQGEWIVPTFNYELRADKPPLHYYHMILAYRIFGVNEFSARFFSAVYGALTVILIFWFCLQYLGKEKAWLSVLILLSSLHLSLQMHMAVPDPYLIFFMTLAILGFFAAITEGKGKYMYWSYLGMALGLLTKGPIAIALPGLIMLLFLLRSKRLNLQNILMLQPLGGLAVVALIGIPWFVAVDHATMGQWTEEFFFRHNVGRFSNTMEGHGGSFLLTFLFVLGGMLPFSLLFIPAVSKIWKASPKDAFEQYALIAALTIIGFFSISSTKLPNYTVPSYPFMAIVLSVYLASHFRYAKWTHFLWGLYLLIAIGLPVGTYVGLAQEESLASYRYLGWGLCLIPLLGFLGYYFFIKRSYQASLGSISLSWILTIFLFFFVLFPPIDKENPVNKQLHLFEGTEPIAQYKRMNRAFMFYLGEEVPSILNEIELKQYWEKHPEALIISRKRYLKDFEGEISYKILFQQKDLFEKYTTVILSLDNKAKIR